jgi:hypothetical protein
MQVSDIETSLNHGLEKQENMENTEYKANNTEKRLTE